MTSLSAILNSDVVKRAYKTLVQATAAQAALYTTIVPNPPSVQTSAAVSGGAALLSIVWNGGLTWITNTKSARLDKLAVAIDRAVDARLAAQAGSVRSVAPSAVAVDVAPPPYFAPVVPPTRDPAAPIST